MNIPLHKIQKRLWLHKRIIMALVCILIGLMYLHAEQVVQSGCPYSHLLMDLQRTCRSKDEHITYKSMRNIQYVSSFKMQMSCVYNVYKIKSGLFSEWFHLRDPNKILHILQRYNC